MSPLVTVLIGTSLLGCTAGVVGSFTVLRRRALVGDLLAHTALPGIGVAFLIVGERQFAALLLGALISGVLGLTLITFITRWTRTKEDAAFGIVLSTFFGGGVALSSVIQRMETGSKAGLETYIYGQAAAMGRQDLLLIGGVSLVALGVIALVYKEFKLLSFDPEFAAVQGWPIFWLDLGMMALVALVTVVGLPAVGVVLMAAMLITPAATARLWTNRLGPLLVIAAVTGAAAATMGTLLSDNRLRASLPWDPFQFGTNTKGLPTGPLIVLVGTTMFIGSLCFAPERGWIARALSHWRLRSRIASEHLLRTLYELSESQLPVLPAVPIAELRDHHAWTLFTTWRVLGQAVRRDFITRSGATISLTPEGVTEAARLTRRHRLWELFLIQGVHVAPDHVDRDADDVEHMLPAEIIAQLEQQLLGTRMAEAAMPTSPHELTTAEKPVGKGANHG
jgi:manganese/zinc/iron transport system permease protein